MSGKGSKRRKGEKLKEYRDNYDQIDWRRPPKLTKEQMAELLTEVKKWQVLAEDKS
jgi:hypothetical protein